MIALSSKTSSSTLALQIAGVAVKLENGLALIESGACDAAIVDSNLGRCECRSLQQSRWQHAGCLSSCCPAIRRNKCKVTLPEGAFFKSRAGQNCSSRH